MFAYVSLNHSLRKILHNTLLSNKSFCFSYKYVCMFPYWAFYDFILKILHQTLQIYSLYQVCKLVCCFRFTTLYNSCSTLFADKWFSSSVFLHITIKLIFNWYSCSSSLQSNGFSPICVCICIFRSTPHQTLQINSFYTVCIIIHCFRFLTIPAPHSLQISVFPPVIFCWWNTNWFLLKIFAPYSLQSNDFSPICVCKCIFWSPPK